jgi:hypothetical protein
MKSRFLFYAAALALMVVPTTSKAETQMERCTDKATTDFKAGYLKDPEYFQNAAYLFGVPLEQYTKLYIVSLANKCKLSADCRLTRTERLCSMMGIHRPFGPNFIED